jgi:lysophospholipase L1-like esterase
MKMYSFLQRFAPRNGCHDKMFNLYTKLLLVSFVTVFQCTTTLMPTRSSKMLTITIEPQTSQKVAQGSPALFYVKSSDHNLLFCRWVKKMSVDTISYRDTLAFTEVRYSDSGIYTCIARDTLGETVCSSCTLHVVSPWDTSFSIDGTYFPNDTILEKAIVSLGSNWRMQQFVNKCKVGGTVRVGFIGGSITAGAAATSSSLRFSSIFCSWLRKRYTALNNVIEINAGIGATDSRFGCSRAQADLLANNPDIIIIEFAVNDDHYADQSRVKRMIEGLIRQCLLYNKNVPVVMLFMAANYGGSSQTTHTDVARYYDLPMISYGNSITPLQLGTAVPNTYYNDGLHPTNNGHLACAWLLYSYVNQVAEATLDPQVSTPSYKYSDLYQNAACLTNGDTVISVLSRSWVATTREHDRITYSTSAGYADTASLIIQGHCAEMSIGLHMTTSSDTSSLHIVVDSGATLDTIVSNAYSLEYTQFICLFESELPKNHIVRIEHASSKPITIDNVIYATRPNQ